MTNAIALPLAVGALSVIPSAALPLSVRVKFPMVLPAPTLTFLTLVDRVTQPLAVRFRVVAATPG